MNWCTDRSHSCRIRYGSLQHVPNGEQALAKFIENENRIQLLVFDVIIPKMNGKDAYEEIRKFRPDIKVLFMSGYAADIFKEKKYPTGLKHRSKTDFLNKYKEGP